jgi:acyl-CoA thioester hydrolase
MSEPATPSRRYPYRIAVEATLRDTDGVGHVNNAVYVNWLEEARTRYAFARRGFSTMSDLDFILASTCVDYRSPVLLHETVDFWCGPSRVGRSSWELVYEGRSRRDGRLVCEARSVQVQYDYAAGRPVPIPDPWRAMLEEDLVR